MVGTRPLIKKRSFLSPVEETEFLTISVAAGLRSTTAKSVHVAAIDVEFYSSKPRIRIARALLERIRSSEVESREEALNDGERPTLGRFGLQRLGVDPRTLIVSVPPVFGDFPAEKEGVFGRLVADLFADT